MTRRVAVIDSGVANLASVLAALRPLATEVTVARRAEDLAGATHLVLPGVGAFGAGLARLRAAGLDTAAVEAIERGQPALAICLGMQMLCEASEEAPGVRGLGVIAGVCRRLPQGVPVPNLGWSWLDVDRGARWLAPGYAAFANSYSLVASPEGARAAWTTYGERRVAALELGSLLACQFHPELSSTWGRALLERWLHGRPVEPVRSMVARRGAVRRLVPCLDVCDGRVVKGVQFQHLRDVGDPAERAAQYEAQGADEIVMLDIGASPQARDTQIDTVRRVRAALTIPLTVGGGVRTVEDARRLLAAGADKISINTAAIAQPDLLAGLAGEFGSQCVVLAIDARRAGDSWEALVLGGRRPAGVDAVRWGAEGARRGAGELLLTSWDRDGTRSGCDLDLLRAITARVSVPVIASGGVGTLDDVAAAFGAGAAAVLAASVFHDGDATVGTLKRDLGARGVVVRQ